MKREDRRTGLLTAVIRRVVGDKKADIFDFFPEHRPKQVKREGESAGQLRANFQVLLEAQKKREKGSSDA